MFLNLKQNELVNAALTDSEIRGVDKLIKPSRVVQA